jgi:hypothetical protein
VRVVSASLGVLTVAAAVVVSGGCAARPDRFAAYRDMPAAAPPDVRRGELAGRGGYASFGSRVRLRDDTPPLTPIIEAERAASLPPVYVLEPMPGGSYGPEGSVGPSDTYGGFGGIGYVGPYLTPVGGLYPGLRPPPLERAPSPFAAPYHPAPDADVARHRPGLSTGSGIYGRNGR